jgi:hypothetical protein
LIDRKDYGYHLLINTMPGEGPVTGLTVYSLTITQTFAPAKGVLPELRPGFITGTIAYCGSEKIEACGSSAFDFAGRSILADRQAWRDAFAAAFPATSTSQKARK